jgi:2-polyprenyl-3-methyl-5-hydroxy-6-metoxy-1,4-benzoquinol methylase
LEIGAGPGSITKQLASVSSCSVTALDIDAESINKIAPFCENTYQADLNNAEWPRILEKEKKFEVIVAADVLEHVYEPIVVLKGMKEFLKEDGYMVISLPHVGHSVIHACLMEENFEYGDSGLLDHTHIRFFGIKNIQKLFEDARMKIVHAEFVVRNPEHTEFTKCWKRTSKELRSVLAKNPFGLVYQVIVKAVPDTAFGDAIKLMDLRVSSQKPTFRDSAKAFLRTHLSTKMYSLIQLIASKMGMTFKG